MHSLHGDLLFETRYGTVLQCACCGRIQIQFRDHTFLVDTGELEILTQTVQHALKRIREQEDTDEWRLQADTDTGAVTVVLAEPALAALRDLLSGAWAMYDLRRRVQAAAPDRPGEPREVLRNHVVGA